MEFLRREAGDRFRGQLLALVRSAWRETGIAVRGERRDLAVCEAFLCVEGETLLGSIHFSFSEDGCEILSLISLREHEGIGRALTGLVLGECRARGARRLTVVTTNDNTRAIRFYQQFGMELSAVRLNQVDEVSRRMKASIPLTGCDGIPIRHELEFSLRL
jgi:GNAT superfamily N-acetyltransferase